MKRTAILVLICSLSALIPLRADAKGADDSIGLRLLDDYATPMYSFGSAVVLGDENDGQGDVGQLEFFGKWSCGYFVDVMGGNIDTHIGLDLILLLDDSDLDLPSQALGLAVDLEWIRDLRNGWSLMLGIRPGIYSGMEEWGASSWSIPFRAGLIKTLSKNFAVAAGMEVRFDFDRLLLPLIGFAWQPGPAFRLEAALPRSSLVLSPVAGWRIYLSWERSSESYDLGGSGASGITIEDRRVLLGNQLMLDDQKALILDAGQTYRRSIALERPGSGNAERDLEPAIFVRAGLAVYF